MSAPRITDVGAMALRAPVSAPVRMAVGQLSARQTVLVTVTVEGGLTGLGESWVNFPSWAPIERLAAIAQGLRPLLLGEEIDSPARLWRKCVDALRPLALQAGAMGPIFQAISGVDIALWDLAGKMAGAPVWQLLGAPEQEGVRAYASGLGPEMPERQAATALASGFDSLKLKVGFTRDLDERNLAAVRGVDRNATLLVDANQGWSLTAAREIAPALDAAGVRWVEEPFAADDLASWREAPRLFEGRLAGGENLYGLGTFNDWLDRGWLNVVQPDVAKCGGITAAREILDAAGGRELRLAPHFFGSAVGLAATIHLFAALPPTQRVRVEYDINPNPLREELLRDSLWLGNGLVRVPSDPGLGVVLQESALERFRVAS